MTMRATRAALPGYAGELLFEKFPEPGERRGPFRYGLYERFHGQLRNDGLLRIH